MQLSGRLSITRFLGLKSDGKEDDGYPFQSSTLKLFGRIWGPLENCVFAIIRILKFFICPKAFPHHLTFLPSCELAIMTSILSVPFRCQITIQIQIKGLEFVLACSKKKVQSL